MEIRPLHDYVIVKRLEGEHRSAGGIVIPDTAAEKPDQGIVMGVGTGRVLNNGKVHAIEVKAGDRILFGKYAGQPVKFHGDELVAMREDNILAVLED